jgi:hypothetical protein
MHILFSLWHICTLIKQKHPLNSFKNLFFFCSLTKLKEKNKLTRQQNSNISTKIDISILSKKKIDYLKRKQTQNP